MSTVEAALKNDPNEKRQLATYDQAREIALKLGSLGLAILALHQLTQVTAAVTFGQGFTALVLMHLFAGGSVMAWYYADSKRN